MTLNLTWHDIVLRLALTFLAGALVGINRGEHARPAGLRTTVLLCLAASIAMIQANWLLSATGKAPDSFVVLDLMRLPLGILTGVGFIGAGAILRKDGMAVGVTTAATLWFVTVMGLCLGGGQIALGLVALVLSLLVLSGLKHVEKHWKQKRGGTLILTVELQEPSEEEICRLILQAGCKVHSWSVSYFKDIQKREYNCTVEWRDYPTTARPPAFLEPLAQHAAIRRLVWQPG